jgi:hypothetical protein
MKQMINNNNILLMPDAAQGTITSTDLKVGDEVSWTDDKGADFEGVIEVVEDTTVVVKNSVDDKKYRVAKDEVSIVEPEGEKVLEIKDGIKFIELKYKKEKKHNPKNVNLEGYTFAVPRFETISTLLTHLDARLKEQNKHKSQDADKGVTAEEVLLDNFNSMVANKLRTRVKNEMQEAFEQKKGEWNTGRPNLLFNVQAAYSWVPGIREPGTNALVKVLSAKISALQLAGKTDFFELGPDGNPDVTKPSEYHKLLKELANVASGGNKAAAPAQESASTTTA